MSLIDEYFSKLEPTQKRELERIRKIVKQIVPDATEVISYGMPVFKFNDKYLIGIAAFQDHMSVFPGSMPVDQLKDKLDGYKLSKGTIQFTADHPLSDAILKELINISLTDIKSS